MHKRLASVGALALALAASAAGAQNVGATRAFSLGIAGGATVPTGDFGDLYGTGFNVMGSLGFQPTALPVGVRFDVAYHSLPGEDVGVFELDDLNIISGTANAVLTVSNTGGVRPYLIGGVGLYRADGGDGDASTNFGINGGGGLDFALAGFSTFVEARYHSVFIDDMGTDAGNLDLIPIVFGLRF